MRKSSLRPCSSVRSSAEGGINCPSVVDAENATGMAEL
jgi:hypothetical protein